MKTFVRSFFFKDKVRMRWVYIINKEKDYSPKRKTERRSTKQKTLESYVLEVSALKPSCCKASLNGHFMGISYTFNRVPYQHFVAVCMKWRGERVKSFHHGETTWRRFPCLGNRVKRLLRRFSFIPLPDPRSRAAAARAIFACFPRASRHSRAQLHLLPARSSLFFRARLPACSVRQ